ncbi:MAG: riboflavin synthase, partial [Rhodothermales bacterium]|nr:riboflavin synthase [Rhodothermales bacterium]
QETRPGDSIAVNGTCLTVTALDSGSFDVDMAPETLSRTNLGDLDARHEVNLERSLTPGSRLGGHFVQGHVDATGTIRSVLSDGDSLRLEIGLQPDLMRYLAPKGYVAVDGVSLTVVDVLDDGFTVMLVPYTMQHVTLPGKSVGGSVNIEVDILAKYVERALVGRYAPEKANHG